MSDEREPDEVQQDDAGEGETPHDPELDVEGPNESAPGTNPSPGEGGGESD